MGLFKTEREKELEGGVERLMKTVDQLRSDLRLKDSSHAVDMTRELANYQITVAHLEATIKKLEAAAETKAEARENSITAEVERRTKAFKDSFITKNEQDLHAIRKASKEETDAAKKRYETELDSAKKSLRAEYEAKIARLEKTNNDLVESNGLYKGHNEGNKKTHEVLSGQLSAMTTMLAKLTGSIADGLPEVSAHITTPVVAAPAAPKQENKGQEQAKK